MDFVKIVGLIVTVWLAIDKINAWRRENLGKRRIELAEDTLALFYEARDTIRYIRSPAGFSHETEDVEQKPGEGDSEFNARKRASVVFYRYNQHQELFNKIHASRYRFMAQIGISEAKSFDELSKILRDITLSAHMLATLWVRDEFNPRSETESRREEIKKHEAIFWEGLEDDDPINPRVEKLVREIEETCRSIILGENRWYKSLLIKLGMSKQLTSNSNKS